MTSARSWLRAPPALVAIWLALTPGRSAVAQEVRRIETDDFFPRSVAVSSDGSRVFLLGNGGGSAPGDRAPGD